MVTAHLHTRRTLAPRTTLLTACSFVLFGCVLCRGLCGFRKGPPKEKKQRAKFTPNDEQKSGQKQQAGKA